MQQPWKQSFATDYHERGNYPPAQPHPIYQNPDTYPPATAASQHPSYNRSAAPFHSSQGQGQAAAGPSPDAYPSTQHAYGGVQSQYQPQPAAAAAQEFDQQVVDRREQVEMDEDFPSYKELRNVFLQKQQQAEMEERSAPPPPSHRRFRQNSGSGSGGQQPAGRKPPPTPSRKPSFPSPSQGNDDHSGGQQQQRQQWQQQQGYPPQPPAYTPRTAAYSPQSPTYTPQTNAYAPQTNTCAPQTNVYAPQTQTSRSTVQITSQAKPDRFSHPPTHRQQTANSYTEIPVQHVSQRAEESQRAYPARQPAEIGYRPPMSINVSTPYSASTNDSPSPRVTITSNSPMSPQRARYRPDDDVDGLIVPRRSDRRHSVSFSPVMMSSSANQPRRRTSYAEIFISGPQTPQTPLARSLSVSSPGLVQRSFSQVTTNRVVNSGPEPYGGGFPSPYGGQQNSGPGFTRVNLRRSSQGNVHHNLMQRQAPGWSATVQTGNAYSHPTINTGPNVQYTPSHSGKSAAHLQYNSPMGLYSTSAAQEALDRDPQAAELLKINGPKGSGTIKISPTLRAVIREDAVKRHTGRNVDVGFYRSHREYGPGIGPLRQYEETPDTLCQNITLYNRQRDKTLTYPVWCPVNQRFA